MKVPLSQLFCYDIGHFDLKNIQVHYFFLIEYSKKINEY